MRLFLSRPNVALVALWLFAGATTWAQSDLGSISGFVKDPQGATVPRANVTVRNQTGLERKVATTDAGHFSVTNIPPSLYTVTVEAAGFKKFVSVNNKLDPSSELTVDVTLTIGATTESIQVSAEATNLQTESASVQKDVTREQLDALELNGRNPIFMASLVPGARGGNLASLNFGMTQGPSNFNGSRNAENLITYDGAPATRTRANGTSIGSADVDSVSEIQVLTANYAPEYGRTSGGQIRLITKSGGTSFHGAAYEYFRNNRLNANTWTRNHTPNQPNLIPFDSVAPFQYNQFGFNIGGPFYIPGKFNKDKSKFFWYWAQEWVKNRYTDTSSWTVPSDLMRAGNFSELLSASNFFYGKVVNIKDPTNGAVLAGNVIPGALQSQNGLGILKSYPIANLTTPVNGTNNFYTTAKHPQNQRKDTLAVDMNLTDRQRIQFRRNNFSFWEYQPLDGTPTRTPKYFDRPNQTNSLDYVWTVTPTLVNEALVTVSIDDVYIPVDTAHFFDRTSVGVNYPYIFPEGKLIPTRIPTAAITNFSTLNGGPYPSHSSGPIYTFSDTLTWVKSSHTFKFGFAFERSGENDNDEINVSACPTCTNNQNGQFSFTDSRAGGSGVGIANAAMGLFDTYSELGTRAYTVFRSNMYEWFVQDNWKINQKLTLNYGVRHTINFPFEAVWRNMSVFDPALYDPSKAVSVDSKTGLITVGTGDRYNGMVIPGSGWPDSAKGRFPEASNTAYSYLFRGGSTPSYFSDVQYGTFQPRVGIAYQMDEKTVIRTGIGRFFSRNGVSDSIFLGGNPPFQPTANVTNGTADNPGGTTTNVRPLTVTTYPKNQANPEAWNWNFTVERRLPWQSVASVGYVGRRGLHLPREVNINQPTLAAVTAAAAGTNLDSLRPYKGYNSIRESQNVATSKYNSLQVTWNRRFDHGLMFGVAYTYSKSEDSGTAYRDIIANSYDASNMWAPSQFDVTHMMTASYLYELPFGRGKMIGKNWGRGLDTVFGGWQLSGIVQLQTGTACSAVVNSDYAGVGVDGNVNDCGGTGNFWSINGDPKVLGGFAANGSADAIYWFQTKNADGSSIFSAPAKGTFASGRITRNFFHNPGLENFNVGLFKRIPVTEKTGFQFRAEAFNALNHPNLNGAGTNPNNAATFGKVTGKNDDVRQMQVSLRFYF